MAVGTGYPLKPEAGRAQVQPAPVIDGDKLSNAADWTRIAESFGKIAKGAGSAFEADAKDAQFDWYVNEDNDANRKRAEMRDQFDGDPEGFDKAWTAHTAGKIAAAPAWGQPYLKRLLGREGNAAYSGLLEQRRRKTTAEGITNFNTSLDNAARDVTAGSMAGTITPSDPEGLPTDPRIIKYQGILQAGVAAGRITQDQADAAVTELQDRTVAITVIREIGDEYRAARANGEVASQRALQVAEDRILRNPDLRLDEAKRYAYYNKAAGEIRALEAERKQDLALARQAANDMRLALQANVLPDQSTLRGLVDQLNAAGGQKEAAELLGAVERAKVIGPFSQLPLREQTRVAREYAGATAPPQPGAAPGYTASRPEVENYIREAARKRGIDENVAMTVYRREGAGAWQSAVVKNGVRERSYGPFQLYIDGGLGNKFMQDTGLDPRDPNTWRENIDYALDQALIGGWGPWYGAKAAGITGRMGLPGGSPARTAAEFYMGQREQSAAAPTYAPGTDYRLIRALHGNIAKQARAEWELLEKDADAGIRPNSDALRTVMDAAAQTGDHMLLSKIGARMGRFEGVAELGRAPEAQQQAALTELERRGAAGELEPGAAALEKDLRAMIAATRKGLEDDAVGHTAKVFPERFGTPRPLDPSNDKALGEGLAYRAQVARFAQENWQTPFAVSALSKQDAAVLQAALSGGNYADKSRILATMAQTLPRDIYSATLAKVGGDELTQLAGQMAIDRPELARSILHGQELMNAEKVSEKAALVRPAFAAKLGGQMFPRVADQSAVVQAAMALYTSRRGTATALYDTTDTHAIEKAVEDITGPIIRRNGQRLPVTPGIQRGAFVNALDNLTDQQLALQGGALDRSGRPLDAAFVGRNAVLKPTTVGSPLYIVGLPDPRATDGFTPIMSGEGFPLVFDMRSLVEGQSPIAAITPYRERRAIMRSETAQRFRETREQVEREGR